MWFCLGGQGYLYWILLAGDRDENGRIKGLIFDPENGRVKGPIFGPSYLEFKNKIFIFDIRFWLGRTKVDP